MLKPFKTDLHIHTVLSPCADLSMGPQDIVNVAVQRGLDIIAITDHNSVENIQGVLQAAENSSLTVIPGMEISTREDIHFVCLFPNIDAASAFQKIVYAHLPQQVNDPTLFGPQYICDGENNIIGECSRILSLPTSLSIEEISKYITDHNAIFYPAHIDRPMHSLLHSLGFLPQNIAIDAVGIAFPGRDNRTTKSFLNNPNYTCICSSDAHHIDLLGMKYSIFHLAEPTFKEINKAVTRQNERFVEIVSFEN